MLCKANSYTKFEISSWAGDILIAIIEAFISLFLMSWDPINIKMLFPHNENAGALLAFLIYFLFLLAVTYIILLIKNYVCFSTRGYVKATDPFIKVKEAGLFPNPISTFHINNHGKEKTDKTIDAEFIYIHFINDPESIIVDSLARDITAVVTYKKKDGEKIFPSFFGVWADKPAISRLKPGEQVRDLLFSNIAPGKLGRKLNIGIHEIGKSYYFAFSQENAKYSLYKNPNLKIKDKEVYVEIDLKGSNVDRTTKYRITRSKGYIQIVQIEKRKWENYVS